MVTKQNIHSDLPIPPGEYLVEVIEELGMTKDELARRMNRPAAKLSAIFKGEKAITPETALQLEKVVGVSAHIWSGLEAEYRLALARIEQANVHAQLKAETRLITRFRYADLVKIGVIEKHSRPVEKVLSLQQFFGVTSLETVPNLKRYQPAFRQGKKSNKSDTPQAIAAWLRIGEGQALKYRCAPFDAMKLKKALPGIRSMTRQVAKQFQDRLHQTLADAGVVLVLCPHMPGTGIQGATFWMGPKKAVVMMTLRYGWADIFWFSLFHELGHILLHGRNTAIIEGVEGDPKLIKKEDQANRFAAEILLPSKEWRSFLAASNFYKKDIQIFAERMGVDAGIVVGRLQHDGYIQKNWHNGLRKQFVWQTQNFKTPPFIRFRRQAKIIILGILNVCLRL
jgi:HTH-type transcriptional regulator / antitoxin HigA